MFGDPPASVRTAVINVTDTELCGWLRTGTQPVKAQDDFTEKIFISQYIFDDFQAINYNQKFNDGKTDMILGHITLPSCLISRVIK